MDENSSKDQEILIGNNDILYKDLVYFLARNSRKLITIISVGLTVSLIYAIRLRNVWQGEFQIVLDNENNQLSTISQSLSSNFDFILDKQNETKITTEVEILKSASILMPIYNSSINKDKEHPNNKKPISFRKWKRNLDIELQKNTSVLVIKYKNQNKKSILPILVDISEVYQRYASNKLDKNLTKGIDYLKSQIKIYRKKSDVSFENSQKFAIKNDLEVINNTPLSFFRDPMMDEESVGLPTSEQDKSAEAATQKRFFTELSKLFKQEETDNEKLTYLASIYKLVDSNAQNELFRIQNQIFTSKAYFTENYSQIKKLESEKQSLLSSIKETALKKIQAKINASDVTIAANQRADGVYLKFNNLNNNYIRDSYTLMDLESQLRLLNLEKAKEPDPYKLITVPTLLNQKIAPNRSQILIIHGLILLFLSNLYAYIHEKIKDLVFSTRELENLIPYNLIEKIPADNQEGWNDYLESISLIHLKNKVNIEIIKLGDIDKDLLDLFLLKIQKFNPDKEIKFINSISKINAKKSQIFITQSGKVTREDLSSIKRKLNCLESSIVGWILFEEKISFKQPKLRN